VLRYTVRCHFAAYANAEVDYTFHLQKKKIVFPYICVTALIFVAPLDIIICKYICSIIISIIIVAFVAGQDSFFQEMEQFLPTLRRICLACLSVGV